nr:MAG TPA: hypothetical protein [Caudoviricetes sp.]
MTYHHYSDLPVSSSLEPYVFRLVVESLIIRLSSR